MTRGEAKKPTEKRIDVKFTTEKHSMSDFLSLYKLRDAVTNF